MVNITDKKIIISGLIFNTILFMILKGHAVSIPSLVESSIAVFVITLLNTLVVLFFVLIIRLIRRKWPSFIIPSIIITALTFLVLVLANWQEQHDSKFSENNTKKQHILLDTFVKPAYSQTLSSISYQLPYVNKLKIKNGAIIENKVESMGFLGEPFRYEITKLNTTNPILRKYLYDKVREEKQLTMLNITNQGNLYLADVTQAGNVFLISIFPRQKTVAISMQYWYSYEDIIVLWHGYGVYR